MNKVDMMSPEKVAEMYGGDKRRIGQAAQMGLVDPTVAVMAGMFIDRMRGAASKEMQPQTTVAQDVMRPPAPTAPAAGLAAAQAAPVERGLAALPVPEDAVPDEYAGGGVVAFTPGGLAGTFEAFMPAEEGTTSFMAPDVPEELVGRIGLAQVHDIRRGKYGTRKEDILKAFGLAPKMAPVETSPSVPAAASEFTPQAAPAAAPTTVGAARAEAAPKEPELDLAGFKKKYGLDEDKLADVRAKIAGMAGDSQLDRRQAANMAMLQAGLGMMAGTSRYALKNIGEGGLRGAQAYATSLKDIKESEKDLFKMQSELAKADQARADGNVKAFLEHQEKAKDYALKVEKLQVDKDVAAAQKTAYLKPSQFKEQYDIYAADQKAMGKTPTFEGFRKVLGTSDENVEMQVRQAAETFVNSPLLASQNAKYKTLLDKAKKGDPKDIEALETYKEQLRQEYIRRNLPGGAPNVASTSGSRTLQWSNIP
jgi:hypothetical protein